MIKWLAKNKIIGVGAASIVVILVIFLIIIDNHKILEKDNLNKTKSDKQIIKTEETTKMEETTKLVDQEMTTMIINEPTSENESVNNNSTNSTDITNNTNSSDNMVDSIEEVSDPLSGMPVMPQESSDQMLQTILNTIVVKNLLTNETYTGNQLYHMTFAWHEVSPNISRNMNGGLKVISDPYDAILPAHEAGLLTTEFDDSGYFIKIIYNMSVLDNIQVKSSLEIKTIEEIAPYLVL